MPIATESRSWENRRSAFRHDWLKNTYLNRLDGFLSGLGAETPDHEWLLEFIEEDLPAWEGKKDEAREVIDAYEEEMSPRTLLKQPPLTNCPQGTKAWLGDLVHRLWRQRYEVEDATEAAHDELDDASEKYDRLSEQLDDVSSVAQLKALRPEFEAFRDACKALGNAMSNFLDEVKAV